MALTNMVRITYGDGSTREIVLADVAFGDDQAEARSGVVSVTPATVRESDGGPVAAGRAARSLAATRPTREEVAGVVLGPVWID